MGTFIEDLLGVHNIRSVGGADGVERKTLEFGGLEVTDQPSTEATRVNLVDHRRALEPVLPAFAQTLQTTDARTYAVYVGYVVAPKTVKHVEAVLETAGSGAQTAEVGLASTPLAPNKAGQTLTMITADGTVDDLTAAAGSGLVRRNTTAFNSGLGIQIASVHLWALVRISMATTQPTFDAVSLDRGIGAALQADSVGALTSATTITGLQTAVIRGACAPLLTVVMD